MEFNGEADHAHALLSVPPNLDLSGCVNTLRATSSRMVRRDFTRGLRRVYLKAPYSGRAPSASSRRGGSPLSPISSIEQQSALE